MNTILSKIMLSLNEEGYFKNNYKLSLLDIPTERELSKGNIPIPQKNELLLFGAAEYADIPVFTCFDVIIPYHDESKYVYSKCILKYVTVNPSYEIDYLPRGYSGICLIEFPNGKPNILNKLAKYNEKKDYPIHDILILTQKEILDELIKKLKLE